MKLSIELASDMADELVRAALWSSIEDTYDAVVNLQKKPKLKAHQEQDLVDAIQDLVALKRSWKYFSISSQHKDLKQFEITI